MENEPNKCNLSSYTFKQDFILNYVGVCLHGGMCICVQVSKEAREVIRSSRSRVTGSCEQSNMDATEQAQVLCKSDACS